jgi:putative hydrolase of the HAD superfamily
MNERIATVTPVEIRAVVLDYGEVICHPPSADKFARTAEALNLDPETFAERYHARRAVYDQGVTSAPDYWRDVANGQIQVTDELLAKLRRWDVELWSDLDPLMLAWLERLGSAGYKTALLSNMHPDMAAHVRQKFQWVQRLDAQILSCELRLVKPSPAIYQSCVQKLGLQPSEVLFIDDRKANVEGAKRTGLNSLLFEGVEPLRTELSRIRFPVLP